MLIRSFRLVIGIMRITITVLADSLKGKRSVVRSLIARVKNTYNVSAAETGLNDIHERAEIGFAFAGSDARIIDAEMKHCLTFIESMPADVIDVQTEILHAEK